MTPSDVGAERPSLKRALNKPRQALPITAFRYLWTKRLVVLAAVLDSTGEALVMYRRH